MAIPVEIEAANDRELVIARKLAATPEALYRCWTEAALIPQWFAPKPLTTEVVEMDLRPGGASRMVMRDGEGGEYPANGVYLELVPGRKLVFTDAFSAGWVTTENPMFTGVITFEPQPDGTTLYTARARHWTAEATKTHSDMGFHTGWGICAEQLEAVAQGL